MTTTIAIIPARGGSKGLPRKNLKLLAGKPMIAWTIEAARDSACFSRILVSTEDAEIASIARQFGAEVPFLRPSELATDTATVVDVVLNGAEWLETHEQFSADQVMLLQPTSPLRTSEDIRSVSGLYFKVGPEAVVSVTTVQHPPHWLKHIDEKGEIHPWLTGQIPDQRQAIGPLYDPNGAIYMTSIGVLRKQGTFYPDHTLAYIMPAERSIDIDNAWEFHLADLVLRTREMSVE